MFLNCGPRGGAKFFHREGFMTCPIRFGCKRRLNYQPSWLVPVSVWIVYMGMRGLASLRSFSDILHLRLAPTWLCELGRVWTLQRGALHLDLPVVFTSAFANDRLFVSAMRKALAQEMHLSGAYVRLRFASI